MLCVVRYRYLRRDYHSSRGVLPNVACLSVIEKPQRECLGPLGPSRDRKKTHTNTQSGEFSSIGWAKQFVLYREIMAVYYKTHTKHKNTKYEQNAACNVKPCPTFILPTSLFKKLIISFKLRDCKRAGCQHRLKQNILFLRGKQTKTNTNGKHKPYFNQKAYDHPLVDIKLTKQHDTESQSHVINYIKTPRGLLEKYLPLQFHSYLVKSADSKARASCIDDSQTFG
jgi:hypothetical protein